MFLSSRSGYLFSARLPTLRSADFQSAVSPNSIRQAVPIIRRRRSFPRSADWKSALQQIGNLYSLSGVVHRRNRSLPVCSAMPPVNNAVAMLNANGSFQENWPRYIFGLGSGTNRKPARSTSLAQPLDRSPDPNADTHSQVPTSHVSPYTACAPRSHKT